MKRRAYWIIFRVAWSLVCAATAVLWGVSCRSPGSGVVYRHGGQGASYAWVLQATAERGGLCRVAWVEGSAGAVPGFSLGSVFAGGTGQSSRGNTLRFAGFVAAWDFRPVRPDRFSPTPSPFIAVLVPFWFFLTASVVPALWLVVRRLRSRRRFAGRRGFLLGPPDCNTGTEVEDTTI